MFNRIVVLAVLAIGSGAFAGDADFILVNRAGYAPNEVFISPTARNNWGNDRLGDNQLPNGQSRKFKLGDTKHCVQDIRVVFTDDESEVDWEGFDLCELNKISLRYDRKSGDVSAETE